MGKVSNFRNFNHFHEEMLRDRAGPLVSPIEDMADEMFHKTLDLEFDTLWDRSDDED